MQITGPWLTAPETQVVCAMLADAGYKALFVGGCVRNTLLQVPVKDIDIATDARPERVLDLARKAGLNAIPTGIDHGTVTVVSGHIPHEITTFRKDVETTGRHARVVFSDDVTEDARRRDFTMNALYADAEGRVVDPLGGLPDLEARCVRFIEDPQARIREDYLRSLRFFRFHAWYGEPEAGLDADALDAIARNLDGLASLSKERVTSELLRLLAADDPAPAVAAMRDTGVLGAVLPGSDDRALAPLVHLEADHDLSAEPIRRLAAMGGYDLNGYLRLSKADMRRLDRLRDGIGNMSPALELGYRMGFDAAVDVLLLRGAVLETPVDPIDLKDAGEGANAKFPLSAYDLMPDLSGQALGDALKALEAEWLSDSLKPTREQLLQRKDLL